MKYLLKLILVLFLTQPLFGQSLSQDPALVKKQLSNGLTYYIYPTDNTKGEAYFRLFLKVGSLQETAEERGLAHFLEHMAFNGIEDFEGNKLVDFLETQGAQFGHDINAHTSFNETIYKLQVPTTNFATIDSTVNILSGWASGILLDSLEIEKERGVVLSEYLSKQNPRLESQDVFLEELLNNSRYSQRRVIGDTLTLKEFDPEVLRDFYQKWYDPSLMAVAVAGDIDPQKVEQLIVKRFADIPTSRPVVEEYDIPSYQKMDVTIFTDEFTDKPELDIIQLTDPLRDINDEETYQEYLLRNITNKLFSERFSNASYDNPPYKNASMSTGNYMPVKGAHIANVELDPDSLQEGLTQFFREVEQVYRYGFTNLEIEKVKREYRSDFERQINSDEPPSGSLMIEEMHKDFFYDNSIITKEEEFRLAQKYLPELDSAMIARKVNGLRNQQQSHLLVTAGDKHKDELPDSARLVKEWKEMAHADIPRYQNDFTVPDVLLEHHPSPGEIVSTTPIPEIDALEMNLSNGMKVIYKQSDLDKDNIIISGFRNGGLYSIDSTKYVSGLYTSPIISASGYGAFTREALNYYLAGNSAKALMLIDKTRTGIYATSSHKDKQSLFELLYLKWMYPKVDSEIFSHIKDQTIRDLNNKEYSSSEEFGNELKKVIRGDNYVTRRMTPDDVQKQVTEDSVLSLYKKFFGSAEGYVVSVISDQPIDSLKNEIVTYLGGLPTGPADLDFQYERKNTIQANRELIRKNGESPRAIVSLVFQQNNLIEDIQSQNLKSDFMEQVLRSKLLKRLREELGAVYSVSVSASATKKPSPLSRQSISLVSEPERVDELIEETQNLIAKIAAGEIDISDEVEKTKVNLIKRHEASIQRNTHWTKSIRDYYYNGYPDWDHVVDFPTSVEQISEQEITQLIEKKFIQTPMVKAVLYPEGE